MIIKNVSKIIQEKLKSKELALSKKRTNANQAFTPDNLTFSDMASRTVFVRMVSNKEGANFEVLEGGDSAISTDDLGNITNPKKKFGYNQVYRKRSDGQIRGLSGIKNISVEYQGGYKGIRKGIVTWTANSLDDLNRFEQHFLTNGVSVLLEWGWVYKDSSKNVYESFFNGYSENERGPINPEAFQTTAPLIQRNKGDYDAMAGVVSNFEYKLNEDGGFDCTTTITTMGINFLPTQNLKSQTFDNHILIDEDYQKSPAKDNLLNCILNLHDVINYEFVGFKQDWEQVLRTIGRYGWESSYIPALISEKNLEKLEWVREDYIQASKDGNNTYVDTHVGFIKVFENKDRSLATEVIYVNEPASGGSASVGSAHQKMFVRWGWFEDNILSRYTTYSSKTSDVIHGQFRSIELELNEENDFTDKMRNVKITNSPFLVPKDVKKFLLPGSNVDIGNLTGFRKSQYGERPEFLRIIRNIRIYERLLRVNADSDYKFASPQDQYGSLRNIFINVDEIQKAFGINADAIAKKKQYGTNNINPPETVNQAMNNLLASLNENYFNFWNFRIVEDAYTRHTKIVDLLSGDTLKQRNYTQFEGDSVDGANSLASPSHEVVKTGIYRFPSFKIGSIVKSQELNFKIPDAQSYISMFSQNLEDIAVSTEGDETAGIISLAASYESSKDVSNEKMKSLYEQVTENVGHKIGNSNNQLRTTSPTPITKDGAFEINVRTAEYWKIFSPGEGSISESTKSDKKDFNRDRDEEVINSQYLENELLRNPKIKNINGLVQPPTNDNSNDNPVELPQNGEITPVNNSDSLLVEPPTAGDKFMGGSDNPKLYKVRHKEVSTEYEIVMFSEAKGTLNTKLRDITVDNLSKHKDYIIPAELSLEVDGIGGVYPAECIHVDYISDKYRENLLVSGSDPNNLDNFVGPRTFFQIFNVTQTVDDNGWTTSLQTKMRFNSEAFKAISLKDLPQKPEPKPLVKPWIPIITDEEYARIENKTGEYADRKSELKRQMREAKKESLFEGNQNILDALNDFQLQDDPDFNKIPDVRLRSSMFLLEESLKRNDDVDLENEEEKAKKLIETFIEVDDEDQNKGEDTKKQIEIKMKRKVPVVKKKKEPFNFEELMKEISAATKKVEENNKQIAANQTKKQKQAAQQQPEDASTYSYDDFQNELIYKLREDYRPLYVTSDDILTGERKGTIRRNDIGKNTRKTFWDTYIEDKKPGGVSEIQHSANFYLDELDKYIEDDRLDNLKVSIDKLKSDGILRVDRNKWWLNYKLTRNPEKGGKLDPAYKPPEGFEGI